MDIGQRRTVSEILSVNRSYLVANFLAELRQKDLTSHALLDFARCTSSKDRKVWVMEVWEVEMYTMG